MSQITTLKEWLNILVNTLIHFVAVKKIDTIHIHGSSEKEPGGERLDFALRGDQRGVQEATAPHQEIVTQTNNKQQQ